MNAKRRMKLEERFRGEAISVYRLAETFEDSHDKVLKGLVWRIYEQDDFKRLPHYSKSRIYGFIDGLENSHQHFLTEWRINFHGDFLRSEQIPKGRWNECQTGKRFYKNSNSVYYG